MSVRVAQVSVLVASCALAAALAPIALGQEAPAPEELGAPTWIEDPSGEVLARLHAALRAVRSEGRVVRVLVWGASHVAGDQFTRVVRERLQRRFGDAGHGVVPAGVPFTFSDHGTLAIRSGPRWHTRAVRGRHRRHDAYGRAGFALETSARTWARIQPRARRGAGSRIAEIELWALGQPGGGGVTLSVDGEPRIRLDTRAARRAPIYDRATAPLGFHRLEIATDGEGPVRLFGVGLETGEPGVIVEAFGVPGARASDRLRWDDDVLRAHLAHRPVDLVLLAYGTNELARRRSLATVEGEVREAIRRARAAAPDAACVVMGPSDWARRTPDGWRPRPRTAPMNQLYRRATLAEGCGYFDLLHFQGGPGASVRWVEAGLMLGDHVHMTGEAYARLGRTLTRALLRGYRRSP